jgi:hypothetical protein
MMVNFEFTQNYEPYLAWRTWTDACHEGYPARLRAIGNC